MVAGTKRGALLFGLHTLVVQLLTALFAALFVEYYFHECLLVVKASTTREGWRVRVSTWGLTFFLVAQIGYAVLSALHRCGLLPLSLLLPFPPSDRRRLSLPQWFSCEHALGVAFGLTWCLLRIPLLPSALGCTIALAAVDTLAPICTAFVTRAAREMVQQRPREGEWVAAVGLAATLAAVPLVFAAALLYDGAAPRSGQLVGFHRYLAAVSVGACVLFSGLQYLRRRVHADDGLILLSREEGESPSAPRFGSGGGGGGSAGGGASAATAVLTEGSEFRAFVQQTCQRRSMKAVLAVRALHVYAHTLLLFGTHLLITLGSGLVTSAAVRAALLAVVLAGSALLRPLCVALCAAVGRKRAVSLAIAAVALTGGLALLLAVLTRSASPVTEAKRAAGTTALLPNSTASDAVADTLSAGTLWCVVLVLAQRLFLEAQRELLDLAQEDVVEEDAILFGRAASMSVWTGRLASVLAVPMQSLSLIVSFLFFAVAGVLRVVQQQQPSQAETAAAARVTLTSTSALPTSTSAGALLMSAPAMQRWVVASGPAVLALLGLQTCGAGVAMWAVWQRVYNLEGKHLQFVQMATRKRKDEQALSLV